MPADVAYLVVAVRRVDASEPPWRKLVGVERGESFGDLTVLSSDMCLPNGAPAIEIDARYCVSVVAYDAAGNASGGDVEVCDRVADCRPYTRDPIPECPRPFSAPEFPAATDEIELKDASPKRWLWERARVAVHPALVRGVRRGARDRARPRGAAMGAESAGCGQVRWGSVTRGCGADPPASVVAS